MEAGSQKRAPVYEALEQLKKRRVVPFDVPGHKRGRGNPELVELLGEKCVSLDVNSMKPLDNLCHPVSVIKEAEELAAEAFRADHAFFMVGGTTSSVQSMVLSVCRAGDKIILPRNVHKSVINALVLCGAIPVYVNPEVDKKLGISLGMEISEVERAILENPGAVAVLVNNPTYYGICSDLRSIVKLAHEHEMLVLVDEAHGTHLYFGEDLPVCAMDAGADMASVSMHKSGGSLTQSSLLLTGKNVNWEYVSQIINLTQTTSASYLLMSSLDISRRNLALRGRESFRKVAEMAEYARAEINDIGGYYAYGKDMVTGFLRLNGETVGAVANRSRIYDEEGKETANFGEVLSAAGCEKAADFVNFCDAFSIPVLSLTDVAGYAASKCEEKKIAKAAAKLTYAFAGATVPKVNVVIGKAFGSAYTVMNSKAIGADMVYAWENAEIGMMDADLAAKIMYAGDDAAALNEKAGEYRELQNSVSSAAARGYVDTVIAPADTRKYVIGAFEMLFTKREDRPSKKHGTV